VAGGAGKKTSTGTARWKQTIARVGYDRQAPCGHVVGTLVPVAPSVLT